MKELRTKEMLNINGGLIRTITEAGAALAGAREIWKISGNKHVINAEKHITHEIVEKVEHVYHEVKDHFISHDDK